VNSSAWKKPVRNINDSHWIDKKGYLTMTQNKGAQIIEKATSLGASMAGIASAELVKTSASHEIHEKIRMGAGGIGSSLGITDVKEIKWPENTKSVLVIAVSHPIEKPELDWFLESGNTPGNWLLQKINRELSAWIEEEFEMKTHGVPYWIGEGGIYLKDAAALSGLGCIGKNNLLITPELGPRVRFRAMLLEDELTPTGPIDFDPCDGCEEFCRKVCPQNAFDGIVLSPVETGTSTLPGRDGFFSRPKCFIRSGHDVENSGIAVYDEFWSEKTWLLGREMAGTYQTQKHIIFCRRCEFSCPIGA
jgi:epoxyqueuosine reductase